MHRSRSTSLAAVGLVSLLQGCSDRGPAVDPGRTDLTVRKSREPKSAAARQPVPLTGQDATVSSGTEVDTVSTQKALFGAGCFWGVEETFRQVEGVISTAVGYSGGTVADPAYQDVCTGRTGHAEVVQVEFDASRVSYDQLLDVFWSCHDPTTLNRQGPDFGSQYRSAIFFHTPEQEAAAKASKERLRQSGRFKRQIVTEITAASDFYRAEEYHQQYLAKRGQGACPSTGHD